MVTSVNACHRLSTHSSSTSSIQRANGYFLAKSVNEKTYPRNVFSSKKGTLLKEFFPEKVQGLIRNLNIYISEILLKSRHGFEKKESVDLMHLNLCNDDKPRERELIFGRIGSRNVTWHPVSWISWRKVSIS